MLGLNEQEETKPYFVNDYAMVKTCAIAYRDHGTLPDMGGMLDQEISLMNDIFRWLALYDESVKLLREQIR